MIEFEQDQQNNFNNVPVSASVPASVSVPVRAADSRTKAMIFAGGFIVVVLAFFFVMIGRQTYKQVDNINLRQAELQRLLADDATEEAVQTAAPFSVSSPIQNVNADSLSGVKTALNPF